MQGKRGPVGSLPDVLGFDHGSTSSDAGLDQQMRWSNMRNSAQNRLPDYMIAPNNTSVGYLNVANQQGPSMGGWDFGEGSSRPTESTHNDQKAEHGWSSTMNVRSGAMLSSEREQRPSHILSLNNVPMNLHNNVEGHGTLFRQNSESNTATRDLNINSEYVVDDDDDDDCQVVECPNAYKSGGSVNERMSSSSSSSHLFGVSSGNGGFLADESDGRPGSSVDGRRISCKRKAIEGNTGQSSGSGSASYIQQSPGSLWHAASIRHNSSSSTSIPTSAGHNIGINMPEQLNPRLGLSVGHVASESTPALTVPGPTEISRRNFRLRRNASHQQDSVTNGILSTEAGVGGATISSTQQQSLGLLPRNNSLDLRPASTTENANQQGHSFVGQLSSRRYPRWNGASSSRTGSLARFAFSGGRDAAPYEVTTSAGVPPRNISEYPMFIPPSDTRNPLPNPPPNWSFSGGNVSVPGNLASTSRGGPSAGVHFPCPWVLQQNHSQYPRRLSEHVRRSLLSSTDTNSSDQNSNFPALHPGASSSQENALPSSSGSHGRPVNSRVAAFLERHLEDDGMGMSYSVRALAAASEGRSRLVSEIRNVLDLMRRGGGGVRFEDLVILENSVFFGIADYYDRHRDMRLDVDNMSYEELLALEERIGNVSTGLSEETILKQMKQRKYLSSETKAAEAEPCCICQEEYNDGEGLGSLDCGHDFHAECIKQWLIQKNICPICKTTGLAK